MSTEHQDRRNRGLRRSKLRAPNPGFVTLSFDRLSPRVAALVPALVPVLFLGVLVVWPLAAVLILLMAYHLVMAGWSRIRGHRQRKGAAHA